MKISINGLVGFCLIFFLLFLVIGCTGNTATNDNKETKEIKEIKEINDKVGMPNPASVFCEENGGKLEIVNGAEGQKGICTLSTGEKCEEWSYLRGECPVKKKSNEPEYHLCTPESRKAEVCMALYDPVCGWFSQKIQCVRYPCAVTASNACEACKNENVESWTKGMCPK